MTQPPPDQAEDLPVAAGVQSQVRPGRSESIRSTLDTKRRQPNPHARIGPAKGRQAVELLDRPH